MDCDRRADKMTSQLHSMVARMPSRRGAVLRRGLYGTTRRRDDVVGGCGASGEVRGVIMADNGAAWDGDSRLAEGNAGDKRGEDEVDGNRGGNMGSGVVAAYRDVVLAFDVVTFWNGFAAGTSSDGVSA